MVTAAVVINVIHLLRKWSIITVYPSVWQRCIPFSKIS